MDIICIFFEKIQFFIRITKKLNFLLVIIYINSIYEETMSIVTNIYLDIQKLLNRIELYLITFFSDNILKGNKLRYITELLLNETDINIFICFSKNFDQNFYLDYQQANLRVDDQYYCITPDLEWFLINRTKLYNNKNINIEIPQGLEWLNDNIKALYCWENNTDELRDDIEFKEPLYLECILNNLINSYYFYLKEIEKKSSKKVVTFNLYNQ